MNRNRRALLGFLGAGALAALGGCTQGTKWVEPPKAPPPAGAKVATIHAAGMH